MKLGIVEIIGMDGAEEGRGGREGGGDGEHAPLQLTPSTAHARAHTHTHESPLQ